MCPKFDRHGHQPFSDVSSRLRNVLENDMTWLERWDFRRPTDIYLKSVVTNHKDKYSRGINLEFLRFRDILYFVTFLADHVCGLQHFLRD